jgi:cytochrome c peroxidase
MMFQRISKLDAGKHNVCSNVFFLCLGFLLPCKLLLADTSPAAPSVKLAPGYSALAFKAPTPGSYHLPVIGTAGDGQVIDSNGTPLTLYDLMAKPGDNNRIVLLSFVYSTCSDVNGCPLATAVLHKIKNRLSKETTVANTLRLITLSFNPTHDTPQRMKEFGQTLTGGGLDWRFLTTESEDRIKPILDAYHQNIEKVYDSQGNSTDTFNHSLRVYLIDGKRQIRNIYNTGLLHPDMVIADIKTLLQEHQVQSSTNQQPTKTSLSGLFQAGDNKQAYDSNRYQTQSIALNHRQGEQTDLLQWVTTPPLGLPKLPIPESNPINPEKIALGRKLFYDRRLSLNNTFSCAMCHVPEQGFTSNEMATAVGIEGRTVRRNSPTLYNVAYMQTLFHDSRENTLEQQVWGPFLAQNEMANPSVGYVIDKINGIADYRTLFQQTFGKPPGMETVGMAIASYERSLNSANSPFDQWYFGKAKNALTQQAQFGFKLFTGNAGCSQCHTVNEKYALFTDNGLHNTGIGYADAMGIQKQTQTLKIQLAPGVFTDVPNAVIDAVSEVKANDLGRYEITQNPHDRWKYKTPSLRNVKLTPPYMHNGSLATLKEVVEFYNRGGIPNDTLDPLIKPLHLTDKEIESLVAFLTSLTGDNVDKLVADAFAAPIGDIER